MIPTPSFDDLARPAADSARWMLDPKVVFLNHGSFGACPRPVLEFQQTVRDSIEKQPVNFFARQLEALLDEARAALAAFVGCNANDLVFVPNATSGVNTVLRCLGFKPGGELLTTDHEYNACRNALNFVAEQAGCRVVVAQVPFPLNHEDQLVEAILSAVTPRTRIALIDHVTSPTALVLPMERLVRELAKRGVETLVDGAHAPGMLPLNLNKLGAAYYTANCHKWVCAPKGAAFLHVRSDLQHAIRPLVISHGANSPRTDRSRFLIEFGWTGTVDPSAYLSVPIALKYMESLAPGGWPAIMRRNHDLAMAVQSILCEAMEITAPCPEHMIGSMAAVPFWDSPEPEPPTSPLYVDPVQDLLLEKHSIEVPIMPWPAHPRRVLRVSAQLYNSLGQYELLAHALKSVR
ncbi:MAG: aminotransferase class V-fold PLP-dependent enzyme [Verrucomicrobiia bacterium]